MNIEENFSKTTCKDRYFFVFFVLLSVKRVYSNRLFILLLSLSLSLSLCTPADILTDLFYFDSHAYLFNEMFILNVDAI